MVALKHYIEGFLIASVLISTSALCPAPTKLDRDRLETRGLAFSEVPSRSEMAITCKYIKVCRKIAEAIFFEARGEPTEGQIAVGGVIMERAKELNASPVAVIHEPRQFSYLDEVKSLDFESETIYAVAYGVWIGTLKPRRRANHYYNPAKLKRKPFWAKKEWYVKTIGNHRFYYIPKGV